MAVDMRKRKLVLMDYLAYGKVGHIGIYSQAVAKGAEKAGFDVEIWCPKNYESDSKYARKVFGEMKPFGKMRFITGMFRRAFEFRRLISSPGLKSGDVLLFHTVVHPFFISLSLALLGARPKATIVVLARRGLKDNVRPVLPNAIQAPLVWLMYAPLAFWLNRAMGVKFATDSELITDELEDFGLKGVFTLPIPHVDFRDCKQESPAPIIGYLGAARVDKGFDILPSIIASILKENRHAKFVIQTYIDPKLKRAASLGGTREKLQAMARASPSSIKLYDSPLGYADYTRLMDQCSIILLPYDARIYGKGTSGILAESIAIGKWIVVPDNTWMSAQKKHYSKISIFQKETPEAIARATLGCISPAHAPSKAEITQQIRNWRKYHSIENFMKIFIKGADSQ